MKTKNKIKKSFHPVMFFIYLSVFIILISGIADLLNLQVTYDKLTTIAGEVESTTIAVNSLLSLDGIKFLLTSVIDNLNEFIPFSTLLIASISFGIALKSGFLKTLSTKLVKKMPKWLVVFIYTLLCIIVSVDSNLGYVLLLPFGAILFMSMNRNPLGGLALGFSSIAVGHGAGLFITAMDYNLSSYTEAGAKLVDTEYTVYQGGNLIFLIVISILLAMLFTLINEKILVRKLGRNQIEEDEEFVFEEEKESKGLVAAFIATFILLIPLVIMIIPSNNSFIGLLLDKSQSTYAKMLFSSDSLFTTNLVGLISFIFGIQGLVFGIVSGSIKKIRDMIVFATDYLKSIGSIFVLVFFAAQLIAIVKETNIPTIVCGLLANLISVSNFSFLPLVIILFVVAMITNILLPSSISKWTILAPNVIPVIMKANVTPEFAQLVYRLGETVTNPISPLFSYMVIFIGFVEVYTKNKNDFSIKNCYKLVIPYFIIATLLCLFVLICWYIIGLPIGLGIYPTV